MTYCLGIKVKEGLLGLSDTRLTSGSETSTARKYYQFQNENCSLFFMTSGLKSIRDKLVIYFSDYLEKESLKVDKMYKIVNVLGDKLRQVRQEDGESLSAAGYSFNLNILIGGQMSSDEEHKLFMVYPEGNWIEIQEGLPFTIIGNSGHGKAILKRTINPDASLRFCLKTGFLSFDSTRVSANDVDFPIDVLVYKKNSFQLIHKRYEEKDLRSVSRQWGDSLKKAINEIAEDWMDEAL